VHIATSYEIVDIRHHNIRSIIAQALRSLNFEVDEEGATLNRRVDIIAINRKKRKAYILDPTIRYEKSNDQPMEVHLEKKSIYDPVVEDMKSKYKLNFNIEVIGILVGARGSISNYARLGT